ncbi:hypothetical protein L218DRAFT_960618 [Marasmius fiardii PR-910]|nr:hypothetical protein L218DRAFT_960618 [Marasmius fiardii PR-910]
MKPAQASAQSRTSRLAFPIRRRPTYQFSRHSTKPVPDSGWTCLDFMVGAGIVVIQPATNRLVLIQDTSTKLWILPRGRKDVGESLEQTALREGFEETGYEVEFLPMYMMTQQPLAPKDHGQFPMKKGEPIYMSTTFWSARYDLHGNMRNGGGEYIVSWYVGQIPENAVHHKGTGMPDEQGYVPHLVTFEEAVRLLASDVERRVVEIAWELYCSHLQYEEELRKITNSAQSDDETQAGKNEGKVQPFVL